MVKAADYKSVLRGVRRFKSFLCHHYPMGAMVMKRLYDEHDELNDDGEAFNEALRSLIIPPIGNMYKRGYSAVDIEHIAHRVVKWACIIADNDIAGDRA